MKKLAFVIVTRNRSDFIGQCLQSIDQTVKQKTRVIIVDNSDSPKKTEDAIRSLCFNHLQINYFFVENTETILADGRNFGVSLLSEELVAFVDDDVTLSPEWFDICQEVFLDTNVSACGGRIVEPDTKTRDPKQDLPIGKILASGKQIANFYLDPGKIVEIDHMRGCNWVLRREAFLAVDGFSRLFRHVYEEADLSLRLKKAGYRIFFEPRMVLDHHCGPRSHPLRQNSPELYFKQLFSAQKFYTFTLIRGYGLFHPITLRYLFMTETGLVALVKNRTWEDFKECLTRILGKLSAIDLYCDSFFENQTFQTHYVKIIHQFQQPA